MDYLVFAYLDGERDASTLYYVNAEDENAAIDVVKEADATAVEWEAKALTEDQAKLYAGFAPGYAHSVGSSEGTRFM